METEKKLRDMLERINTLNNIIEDAREARKERDELRKEISKIMQFYMETVNERY